MDCENTEDTGSSVTCDHLWLQVCLENGSLGSWDSEGSSGDCSSSVAVPSASQSPGIPRPLPGVINSASPMLLVGPACGEHLLAKGFGLTSACTDQGQPPLEQPDCFWLLQHLAWLSSRSSCSLLVKQEGDQLLSLVSVFQAWRRMDEPESQPARVMVEKVVRKIAESCRASTKLETDLGLKVFCLIPE